MTPRSVSSELGIPPRMVRISIEAIGRVASQCSKENEEFHVVASPPKVPGSQCVTSELRRRPSGGRRITGCIPRGVTRIARAAGRADLRHRQQRDENRPVRHQRNGDQRLADQRPGRQYLREHRHLGGERFCFQFLRGHGRRIHHLGRDDQCVIDHRPELRRTGAVRPYCFRIAALRHHG
jgi:hypothetical protein